MEYAALAIFLALIIFSIVLNVQDMKWFVDLTEKDAKEKLLALNLDGMELRRYRRRRNRMGRFSSGSESLSDFVQIPLDSPLPENVGQKDAPPSLVKSVFELAKGTAVFAQESDRLILFGKKDGKEHKIYSCEFSLENLKLMKGTCGYLETKKSF